MARLKLGEILLQQGHVDELQVNAALAYQRQWGGRLGKILIEQEMVDETAMYEALAAQNGIRLVSIPKLNPAVSIVTMLPHDYCEQKRVIACAIQEDKRVVGVATSEPQDSSIQDDVSFRTGYNARVVLAPEREIEWALRRYYKGDASPCPPPRTKRVTPTADEFKIVDAAGKTVMKSVEQLRAEHEAQQAAQQQQRPQFPQLQEQRPTDVSGPFAAARPPAAGIAPLEQEMAKLRAGLAEQTLVIRCLVDVCIKKGVFSGEELQALVQEARSRR